MWQRAQGSRLIWSQNSLHLNLTSPCGLCRNKWIHGGLTPQPTTQMIQCKCPNARHDRTAPKVLCLCLHGSVGFWQHKGNLHNIQQVVLMLWLNCIFVWENPERWAMLHIERTTVTSSKKIYTNKLIVIAIWPISDPKKAPAGNQRRVSRVEPSLT